MSMSPRVISALQSELSREQGRLRHLTERATEAEGLLERATQHLADTRRAVSDSQAAVDELKAALVGADAPAQESRWAGYFDDFDDAGGNIRSQLDRRQPREVAAQPAILDITAQIARSR